MTWLALSFGTYFLAVTSIALARRPRPFVDQLTLVVAALVFTYVSAHSLLAFLIAR
jgi:hypothetical protein